MDIDNSKIWLIYTLIGLILSCVIMLGYKVPKGIWGVYGMGFAILGILLAIFKKDSEKLDNL